MYQSRGNQIVYVSGNDDMGIRAKCRTAMDADRASELLNKARYLNDVKRKYTAAARLIAQAETINGFRWIDEPLQGLDAQFFELPPLLMNFPPDEQK